MNIQVYKRLANVLGLSGLLILSNTSVNAETIVHTTRYSYDTETSADTSPQVEKTNYKAPAKAKSKSVKKNEIKPHRPVPYSWESAVEYAKVYPEDIRVHRKGGYKDIYGNFSRMRVLDFLGDDGLANRGNSILGVGNFTKLRVTLNYGQATVQRQPFAIIYWNFNKLHDGNTSNPYTINIVFESGYVKSLSTAKEWYAAYLHPGLVVNTFASDYSGSVLLTREEIWDIYQHGKIANVYLDNGGYGGVSFFYSGDKQEEHKQQLTYGFEHMVRLLNITPATIAYERNIRLAAEKQAYRNGLRSEVKNEIYKEEIKKEIMDEVLKNYQDDKVFIDEWGGKY